MAFQRSFCAALALTLLVLNNRLKWFRGAIEYHGCLKLEPVHCLPYILLAAPSVEQTWWLGYSETFVSSTAETQLAWIS